jgi:hypothetical protein
VRVLLLLLCCANVAFAQPELVLYQKIEILAKDSMQMYLEPRFFKRFKDVEQPFIYTYFCKKDSIEKCEIPDSLDGKAKSYFLKYAETGDCAGCDILVYKTYGTSATYLTKHLLEYDPESQAFIAFHEAMHQHLQHIGRPNYAIEEALCDAFANKCIVYYADYLGLDKTRAIQIAAWHSVIYTEVNRVISTIKNTKDITKIKAIHREFALFLHLFLPTASPFQRERFDYTINNAYFYRQYDYAWYFFKISDEMRKMLQKPKSSPADVIEVAKTIDVLKLQPVHNSKY